jgi:hypothetical protein
MPYFPDTSVLGPGSLNGALSGAVELSFSGPAQSSSVDAAGIGTVFLSGGANIQNAGVQVGYAGYINFDGTALASVAIAANTATITYNGGAGGAALLVQDEGLNTQAVQLMNFVGTGVTATVSPANTATITINAGAASAGGLDRSIQYNDATSISGSNIVDIDLSGNLNLASAVSGGWSPLTPSADSITLFSKKRGGRNLLGFIGPSGLDVMVQPNIFLNKVTLHNASDASTTITSFGAAAPATTGTAVAAVQATTNFSSTLARINYGNPAGPAGTTAGWGSPTAPYWIGSRAGEGGFYFVARVILASSGTVADRRFFCGFQTGTAYAATSPGNQDPTSVVNCFGVAKTATGTQYIFTHTNAAGANVAVNTGITHNYGDVLEVRIFAKPSATQINMSLEVLSVGGSGVVGAGPLAEYATTGNLLNLPANTTPLAWRTYMQMTGTTVGNRFAPMTVYTERDY